MSKKMHQLHFLTMKFFFLIRKDKCGDQLLVSLFDITNNYINVLYKDIKTGSAHVTLFDITNLYKQDAVNVTRLQFICGIGLEFASKLQKSMALMQYA